MDGNKKELTATEACQPHDCRTHQHDRVPDPQATCEHDLYITCKKCDYSEDVKAVPTSEEVRCIHQECKDPATKAREIVGVCLRNSQSTESELIGFVTAALEAERKAGREERDISCPNKYCQEDHDKGYCGCPPNTLYAEGYRRGLEEAAKVVEDDCISDHNDIPDDGVCWVHTLAERIRQLGGER